MGIKLSKDYMYRMELNSILQISFFDVWKDKNKRDDYGYLRCTNAMISPDLDNLETFEDHIKHCEGCEQDQLLRFSAMYIKDYGDRMQRATKPASIATSNESDEQYTQIKSTDELTSSSHNLQYDSASFKYASIAFLYPHGDELYTGKNAFGEDGNLHPIYNPLVWKKIKSELSNNLHVSADPNIKAYFGIESPAELKYFKKVYGISYENKVLDAAKNVYILEIKLRQIERAIDEREDKGKKTESNAKLTKLQVQKGVLEEELRKPSADFEKIAEERKKLEAKINDFASNLNLGIEFDEAKIRDEANGSLSTYEDSQENALSKMDDEYRKFVLKEHDKVVKNTVTWRELAAGTKNR